MIRLQHILAILFVTTLVHSADGQAPVDGFFKEKGTLDAGIGFGMENSDTYFAGRTKIDLTRDTRTAALFAKAGIAKNFNIDLSIPYVLVNSNGGLQDGAIYLKYRFVEHRFSKSQIDLGLAAGFQSNLTDYKTESGSSIGQQAQTLDIRPILHFQMDNGWFSTAQFAYLLKGDPVPSAITGALKIGRASTTDYFDIWYAFQQADGGLDYRGEPSPTTFRELGTDYHKAGATYYRPLSDNLGAYMGASYVLDGRNVSQGIGINAGLVMKVK